MTEIPMICDRPSPRILDDMLGVAGCRPGHGPQAGPCARRLRASAWATLKRLRECHGSLAEARRAAEMRALVARVSGAGRAS